MPRVTGRPIDERARARLRDAQRVESDAVALVLAAEVNRERTRAKLDAVIAKHQVAIEEADHALSKAQAHLVTVSGMDRAALLVDQPVGALRAAVRNLQMNKAAAVGRSTESDQGQGEPSEHGDTQDATEGIHPTQHLVARPPSEGRRSEDNQDIAYPALGVTQPHHHRSQQPHPELPVGQLHQRDPAGLPAAEHPVQKPPAIPCQLTSSQRRTPPGRCPPQGSHGPRGAPRGTRPILPQDAI